MRDEDKKYVWWGLLGIGVAALFYFLSSNKQGQAVNTPVLVEQPLGQNTTGASPTASTSLSNQSNIIGNSPNQTIPNGTNPGGIVSANQTEMPGTWNLLPNLNIQSVNQPGNNINWAAYSANNPILSNTISTPNEGIP